MSDDIKKTDAGAEEKPEAVKKTTVSKKKAKAESTDDSANDTNKKNIIEKLQAMGVMSGKKTDTAGNDNSETGGFLKITIAVVVAIGVVGSFVWALNKEAAEDGLALNAHDHTVPSAYPNTHNNRGYNANNNYNGEQQQRVQRQREQQKKWMQQQQQAQQQQRVQQQKWAQQWQQAQEQQRAQQQKWAQQPPTQSQYRSQQEKWAQQQRQAQEQQRMQQQKWAQQWRLAQEQQRTQQQQNPYYNYSPQAGYQRQPYYNIPRYQHPGSSYRPQY